MEYTLEQLEKEPIKIAEGIYWVGYTDENRGLHCNPYLIIEGDEAVLIDGGNRDDFSTVMLKILRTGLNPSKISRLIYQHYDPDLCGSLPQLEDIINNKDLKVLSHKENNVFIHYYSDRTEKIDFRDLGGYFDFSTGRRLEFYGAPYCHLPGSFVTYDTKTKTLFSSDLFGSYDSRWSLMLDINDGCSDCENTDDCYQNLPKCAINGILNFNRIIMTSNRAFSNALDTIEKLDIDRIAPQHGSIINTRQDVNTIFKHLRKLDNIGIDSLL